MSAIIDDEPMVVATLQSSLHARCIVCGSKHSRGLRLAFSTQPDRCVVAQCPCEQLYQEYTGCLSYGVIAALLDSAMTNCLFAQGRAAIPRRKGITNVLLILCLNAAGKGYIIAVRFGFDIQEYMTADSTVEIL